MFNDNVEERYGLAIERIKDVLLSPETAEHLCSKCVHYAEEWAPVADKLWAEEHKE